MAAVVVFTAQGCRHCRRALSVLREAGAEPAVVSLTADPARRADMEGLCGRSAVPQVFVNGRHVGGASDLDALLASGELADMLSAPADAASDPRLRPPERAAPTLRRIPRSEPLRHEFPGGDRPTYAQMGMRLRDCVRGQFTDADAVQALSCGVRGPRPAEAVAAAVEVLKVRGYVKEEGGRCTVAAHSSPLVLNRLRRWLEEPACPAALVAELSERMAELKARHCDAEGVDYWAIAEDCDYADFVEATAAVQAVDLRSLGEAERKAFTINLYNVAVQHAFVEAGIPLSDIPRLRYFDAVAYDVGGLVYSLNDLENGVLRSNRKAPYHIRRHFGGSDARLASCMPTVDHRIHFALNCGAHSCPPVRLYTESGLDEELDAAARGFCEDGSAVRLEGTVLRVSQILSWYSEDFGGGGAETAKVVAPHLPQQTRERLTGLVDAGTVRVGTLPYNWGTDAKAGRFHVFTSPGAACARLGGKRRCCPCALM